MNQAMNDLLPLVLVALLVLVGGCLAGLVLLWWRHIGLTARVTRLEVRGESALTHDELRRLYERLGGIEGQVAASNRMMQTVQEHLMERDR